MAHLPNLKEQILNTAKALSAQYGIANINVRMVAKETGIALGTIYNYYPTKGDIIAAVVADFWTSVFANINFSVLNEMEFIAALEAIYYQLLHYLNNFKENWLQQLMSLSSTDKTIGRAKEQEYLLRLHTMIQKSLEQHQTVLDRYTPDEISALSFFIYENLLTMLKKNVQEFGLFKKILIRALS